MSDELVVWLRAQLDEDERLAQAAQDGDVTIGQWKRYQEDLEPGEERLFESSAILDGHGGHVVYDEGAPSVEEARHIAEHDPDRVLREVEAARLLIDRYVAVRDLVARCSADYAAWAAGKGVPDVAPAASQNDPGLLAGLEFAVRARALPYSDRPGYRPEWRPA